MNLPRLFHTVKYLKPVQIYGRLWFKLYKPRPEMSPAPVTRSIKTNWVSPCKKKSSLLSFNRFRFLNQEHELYSEKDWNNPQWEKLWLYNLHYFDDLEAWDAENKKALHLDLIGRWIEENPPGMGNGWEPYPTSLRIVNWIKWALAGNGLPDKAMSSLAIQARYLLKKPEVHLLGNHLFANAKALVFAGLFFDGNDAELWLNKGLKILSKQVPEQILDDGGHFELSPMYHSIILEDLLDIINIIKAYGWTPPVIWLSSVKKMLFWFKVMCHPDKKPSFFNDCTFGIASDLVELEQYAVCLGISNVDFTREGINPFRLLYVSILAVYKHQWHVVVAVAALRKKGFPVAIDFVGSFSPQAMCMFKDTVQRVDPEGSFINYKEFIPYNELPEVYQKADAFVFASSCENMPNILLEAMAAGLPIACSNRGPMPEVLGNAGVYFDPESPDQIADVLTMLLKDHSLRVRLAQEAYDRVGKYSWERCARETFSFLADVVEEWPERCCRTGVERKDGGGG